MIPELPDPKQPRTQIRDMVSPGNDDEFRSSLPESTVGEPTDRPGRRKRADAGQPRTPRKPKEGAEVIVDPVLDRAKRKYATLGGGTAVKKIFDMLDKPLNMQEVEDVDDYFYLVAKKGNLDPSQSWLIMIVCGLILVMSLLGTRTSIGEQLKELFNPPKKEETDKTIEGAVTLPIETEEED